jgi:hypothetical protein
MGELSMAAKMTSAERAGETALLVTGIRAGAARVPVGPAVAPPGRRS